MMAFWLAFTIVGSWASAQEPVFETTITTAPLNSSYRKVITREEIQRSQADDLVQLLTEMAGITTHSNAFNMDTIFIRGGDVGHILFLIDGFPIYDALSDKRTFTLKSINLASIQKIEVIKGAQTALYGGQALSGVIKIETVNFSPSETSFKTQLIGGDHDHQQAFANWMSKRNLESIPQLGGFFQKRNNESPVENSSKNYPERQWAGEGAWLRRTESGNAIILRARTFDEKRDITSRGMTGVIDADNFEAVKKHNLVGLGYIGKERTTSPTATMSYVDSVRSYYQRGAFDQTYEGQLLNVRLEKPLFAHETLSASVGASWAKEQGEINNVLGQNPARNGNRGTFDQTLWSLFARSSVDLEEGWTVDAGARWEHLPDDKVVSLQLGTAYKTWRLEYARGAKAPTIFNYFDFIYGNPDVRTEVADTVTLEKVFPLNERASYSLAGFYAKHDDLIDLANLGAGLKSVNFDVETLGVEGVGRLKIADIWSLDINTTYQDVRDTTRNRRMVRRPYFFGSAQLATTWSDRFSTMVSYFYTGERQDFGATTTQIIKLAAYDTVGIGAQYRQSPSFNWNLRVNNVFDQRYSDSFQYFSEGISATLALEYEN